MLRIKNYIDLSEFNAIVFNNNNNKGDLTLFILLLSKVDKSNKCEGYRCYL